MGLLTKRLSFDFGTSTIRIVKNGELVLSESTKISYDENFQVIAVGNDVIVDSNTKIIEPLRAGVITDFNAFEQLNRALIKKALGLSNSFFSPTLSVLTLIPDYCTEVEIRAVRDAMEHAGARKVFMLYSSFASIKGIGLDGKDTSLIIDAGAGKISNSVVSDNWLYCPSRVDFGSDKLKQLIGFFIKKKYDIICDSSTLEDILKNHLSFLSAPKIKNNQISGKDSYGTNSSAEIDMVQINDYLTPYYRMILDNVQLTIDTYQAKHNKTLNYIVITGGLSKLNGFEKGLSEQIKTPVINKSDSDYTLIGLKQLDANFENNPYTIV